MRKQLFSHVRPSGKRLLSWLFDWRGLSGEELPLQVRGKAWSLALFLVGFVFWILRRLSPMEWIGHAAFDSDTYDPETHRWTRGTPTSYVECYSLALFFLSLSLIEGLRFVPQLWWLPLVWVALVMQSTLYYSFWRSAVRIVPSVSEPGNAVSLEGVVANHQHLRNLVLTIFALVQITWLFAVVYYVRFGERDFQNPLIFESDAFYTSLKVSLLQGLADRNEPKLDQEGHSALKYVLIAHSLCALVLLVCIASRGLAAAVTAREPYGEPAE
ncbi:MAG: hypothetical protein SFU86_07195 [Pirellulaceae bacterium]|nr:hypothetical protein [Pirellulaceae bacterium]